MVIYTVHSSKTLAKIIIEIKVMKINFNHEIKHHIKVASTFQTHYNPNWQIKGRDKYNCKLKIKVFTFAINPCKMMY